MSTLLLDGDMIVHRSCVAVEKDTRFDDRYHILFSSFDDAWALLQDTLSELTDLAGTDDVVFCLSDPEANWRKTLVDPTYKSHRAGSRKPLAYWSVIEQIKSSYEWSMMPTLEADDVLGILMTMGQYDEPILWSLDKDLKQIPGLHLVEDAVVEITPEQGHWFHMYQTLVGDTADGYPGCPGVGKEIAARALNSGMKLVPYEHTLKSGKNKGNIETRWNEVPADNLWEIVVSYYEKAGLTEQDALHQARISQILQANSFDNGEIKLWNPN